jgi:hypothetical protein
MQGPAAAPQGPGSSQAALPPLSLGPPWAGEASTAPTAAGFASRHPAPVLAAAALAGPPAPAPAVPAAGLHPEGAFGGGGDAAAGGAAGAGVDARGSRAAGDAAAASAAPSRPKRPRQAAPKASRSGQRSKTACGRAATSAFKGAHARGRV